MLLPSLNVKIEPTTAEQMRVINEIAGIVYLENDVFGIEYTVESLMSALAGKFGGAGKVHHYDLPLEKLSSVTYKKGLFGARLIVQPSRLAVLDGMHGIESNCLRLNVKRADREIAQQYASRINLRISELQLQKLDSTNQDEMNRLGNSGNAGLDRDKNSDQIGDSHEEGTTD